MVSAVLPQRKLTGLIVDESDWGRQQLSDQYCEPFITCMKKMKMYFMGMLCAFTLFSCNENDDLFLDAPDVDGDNIPAVVNDVSVTEDGFLNFTSFNALEKVVNDIEAGEAIGISGSTTLTRALAEKQFLSVAMLRRDINDGIGGGGYVPPLPNPNDNLEEMSVHEYRLMKSEELLLDNVLAEVLDTTLRIGVDDRIYKITEHGTFSVPKSKRSLLDREISNFKPSLIANKEPGASISLNNDVVFTNTFRSIIKIIRFIY